MKQFKHYLFITASIVMVAGCSSRKDDNTSMAGFSAKASMMPVQNITASEIEIATRICYAYQSKNTNFRYTNYLAGKFFFSVSQKDCSLNGATFNIQSQLKDVNSTSLVFEAQTNTDKPFFSKVQTNTSGYLSQLCDKVQNNLQASNTVRDSASGLTIQVRFFKDDLDSYTLNYFNVAANGTSQINSSETIKVRTQFNISGNQILGMDERYFKYKVCADATKFTEFTQSFTSFTEQL